MVNALQKWGDNGFIKIMKDTGTTGGLCGVAMQASYPTPAGSPPLVSCKPSAKTPEICPDGKPCPSSGECPIVDTSRSSKVLENVEE